MTVAAASDTQTSNMAQKYFARKVEFDGITFDSREEMKEYIILKDRLSKGEISQLHRQVMFEIIPRLTKKVIVHLKTKDKVVDKFIEQRKVYTCDFLYREGDSIIIEEVKSFMSRQARDFPLRRALMLKKILEHNNKRGRDTFKFREVVLEKNGKHKITTK